MFGRMTRKRPDDDGLYGHAKRIVGTFNSADSAGREDFFEGLRTASSVLKTNAPDFHSYTADQRCLLANEMLAGLDAPGVSIPKRLGAFTIPVWLMAGAKSGDDAARAKELLDAFILNMEALEQQIYS